MAAKLWTPTAVPVGCAIPMPSCDYCGAHVSERFARVFADEFGRVRACPNCSANAGIAEVSRHRAGDVDA